MTELNIFPMDPWILVHMHIEHPLLLQFGGLCDGLTPHSHKENSYKNFLSKSKKTASPVDLPEFQIDIKTKHLKGIPSWAFGGTK